MLDNIKRLIQESEKVEKTLGLLQDSYFLYDDSNVIRETFISEINKKVPLIGSISYFDKVSLDDEIKLITPKNRLKFEVKENLLLDELAFQLQPTLGNKTINLRKRDIDNFNILIIPKKSIGQKRKMDEIIVDTLFIKGLQSYDKYTILNPLDIDFRSKNLNQKLEDYRGYKYMLTLKNILFRANFENKTENIIVICHNLNTAKKALINGKKYNILGVINLNQIKNWETIKGESIYVNANLTDIHYPEKASHLSFPFKATTPMELLEFSCELLDDSSKTIKFREGETKVPVFDFILDILK